MLIRGLHYVTVLELTLIVGKGVEQKNSKSVFTLIRFDSNLIALIKNQ